MAWDTEGTRRRLKAAAVEEFALHGRHGTRMSAIAVRAGLNKERLYNYFGDKDALFVAVLADQLEALAAAVPLTAEMIDDFGEFAGRTFDHHGAHPQLVRLLQWEALDGDRPAPSPVRAALYREKVDLIAAAQRDGRISRALPASDLLFAVIALAAWWRAVPQVAEMVTGAGTDDPGERDRRRSSVVTAARHLAGQDRH